MPETKAEIKPDTVRQRRSKGLVHKQSVQESQNSYFYPKNNLYTRQEFELLDTIYSDEPPTETNLSDKVLIETFWPQNKEEYLKTSLKKTSTITYLGWFFCGVMLTSVIWLIYFQIKVNEIRTKVDTQIVFQKSAALVTDKTVDKEVSKELHTSKQANQVKQEPVKKEVVKKFGFPNWFSSKQKKEIPVAPAPIQAVKYHTVADRDSLWGIANKYYSNPSPQNIDKIMQANNMKRIGTLSIGQKLVIPQ